MRIEFKYGVRLPIIKFNLGSSLSPETKLKLAQGPGYVWQGEYQLIPIIDVSEIQMEYSWIQIIVSKLFSLNHHFGRF